KRNQPLHVFAHSRLDTWQSIPNKESIPSTTFQLTHKPVHVQAHSKVNTWNNNIILKRNKVSQEKQQLIHVDTRSKIDTWLESSTKNTSLHRSKSLSKRSIDLSHIKPTINTWNDQYKKSKNIIEILHQPIHVEAHSKLDTFQSQEFLFEKENLSQETHQIHIEAKSTIHPWNNYQTIKRHRSLSPIQNLEKQQTIFINPKSTIQTWNLNKSIKTKVKDIDLHQRTNIIGKSTIDNWNNISKRKINKQNEEINTRPIHIDSHSQIDTWLDDIKQRNVLTTNINEKPSMIHFDHVKSTIDNWNEHIDSSRSLSLSTEKKNLFFIDSKSSIDTWQDNTKSYQRSKRKLLKIPEPSIIREETLYISTPTNDINNEQKSQIKSRIHFQPVSHVDCWNWPYRPRKQLHPLRKTSLQNDSYMLSNYEILPPIQSSISERLVGGSTKPQWNSTTSKTSSAQHTTHKPASGTTKTSNQKSQLNVKSKIGSLDNAHHKPGGVSTAKGENKKSDSKEKSKPKTDSNVHEIMTTGGGGNDGNEASATVNEEHQQTVDETSNEIMESQKNDDGDK
ncbi:unnamed protein product, partial [Rotaria sordida]